MKKLQIILIAAILFTTASNTNAQLLSAKLPAEEKSFETNSSVNAANAHSSASVMINKAGIRAVKNFRSQFKNREDAKWFANEETISAYFNGDGIRNVVTYTSAGNFLRHMKMYDESKMPSDIHELVKRSIFYNYAITGVQEILEGDILFYVVHLENDKSFKQVTVYDGEVNLLTDIKKQTN